MEITLSPIFLSLKIAAISTITAILLGVPIAFLLSRKIGKIWDFLDTVVNIPVVMPPTVLGYYLLILLGRRSFIGKFLEERFDITIVFTQIGAVVAALIVSLPYIIKTSKAAFLTVNQNYINAAKLMGVSELKIFLKIILPLSSNGVIAGITMAFVRAMGDFGTTLMISGSIPDKTLTMPIAIYNSMQEGNSAMTNTLVIIMTLTAMVILFILNLSERKIKRR